MRFRAFARPALAALAIVGLVWWMVAGPRADSDLVDNATVVATLVGIAALFAAFRRPDAPGSDILSAPSALSAEQERAAVERLAREMSWVWREQAQLRGIRRVVAPVAVRWQWAAEDIAAPPDDFRRFAPDLRTAGSVSDLGAGLYRALPADTRIVILGKEGAGKTGAVLALLLDVLGARRGDAEQPVPVLLSLGGWHPDTPLLRWAAETIARDYRTAVPGAAPVQVAAELLRRERVALFLDGLDELPEEVRGRALQAIDEQGLGLRVVVTSRRDEYEAALSTGQLGAAAVVELLQPDPASIEDFLVTGLVGERRAPWQKVAAYLRDNPDSVVASTLTTPLALTLARQTYSVDGDPTELIAQGRYPTGNALLHHLIGRFLDQAYPDDRSRADALYWLAWIAGKSRDEPDLAWWRIPGWLPSWAHAVFYGLAAGLGAGVVVAVATALAGGSGRPVDTSAAVNDGWVAALVVGVTVGALLSKVDTLWPRLTGPPAPDRGGLPATGMRVRGPRSLSLRRPGLHTIVAVGRAVSDAWVGGWSTFLGLGITAAVVFFAAGFGQSLPGRFGYAVVAGVLCFPAAFVVGVVALGFVNVFTRPLTDSAATTPSRSYAADRAASIAYAVVVLIAGAAVAAVVVGFDGFAHPPLSWLLLLEPDQRFLTWLLVALAIGGGVAVILAAGLAMDAVPAVKVSEYLLWVAHGRRVRFGALLDAALARQVLRQAGAVYQFRHSAFQEHLADLDTLGPEWLRRPWLARASLASAAALLVIAGGAVTLAVRDKPFAALPGFTDDVTAFAFSPDGATIAAGGHDGTIRIVNIATDTVVRTLAGHRGKIIWVAYAPGGGELASRGEDGTVRVWDSGNGRTLHTLVLEDATDSSQVVYSQDGTMLAAADGKSVRLWNAATGRLLRTVAAQKHQVATVAFADGGRTLVTTNTGSDTHLWNVRTGSRVKTLAEAAGATVSGDGSIVAVGASPVHLVRGATGEEIRTVEASGGPVVVTNDGTKMMVKPHLEDGFDLWLWDTSTGRRGLRLTHPDVVRAGQLSFTPDGKRLAGAIDQRIVLWRTDTGEHTRTICLAVSYRTDSRYAGCGSG